MTFGGGATVHGGVTAVRPRTSDANRTVWTRDDGERVLSDGETEFARVPDAGTLSKDSVPAYYSHDRETGQYTVHKPGETRVYDSKADFETEWTPIKRPFIPDVELPEADVSRDSYIVLILPTDGCPMIFQHGETYPLSESPYSEELWPGTPTDAPAESEGSTTNPSEDVQTDPTGSDLQATDKSLDIDPTDDGVEAFAAMYVREIDGAQIPKDDLFQVYTTWVETHGLDGTNKVWFARKLANTVTCESSRVRTSGERVNVYTGIDLTTEGYQLFDQ